MFHVEHEKFSCMTQVKEITGNIVDIFHEAIYPGIVRITNGIITDIERIDKVVENYILPALVDAHIHIESSMVTPAHFAEAAVRHGTVATVSDPHEIANVLGLEGVEYMIRNGKSVPFKFYFGAPSCVPATGFETSGAVLDADLVNQLLQREDIYFLSEMMNFPGVLHKDAEVMEKLNSARRNHKKIDGHAPGLTGEDLDAYISAGIQTDHECTTYTEAREKIEKGMIIQIREGSAARNFEKLYPLIDEFPEQVMLCSDDLHPDDLVKGHLDILLRKGIAKGLNVFNLIKAISKNPVFHYHLNVGMLRIDDFADMVVVHDLVDFKISSTFINGVRVFDGVRLNFKAGIQETPNNFLGNQPKPADLSITAKKGRIRVIEARDGELITGTYFVQPKVKDGLVLQDIENDILKIAVVNRYKPEKPAVGFIHNFGLTRGALASSIAHDSHNIIVVGTNDQEMLEIIEWINQNRGGIAIHDGMKITGLPLPVAGIISDMPADETARRYAYIDKLAKLSGTTLRAPFMTLSFMALLVIPELKIGNQGLFDVNHFAFTSLFENEL